MVNAQCELDDCSGTNSHGWKFCRDSDGDTLKVCDTCRREKEGYEAI